MGRPSQGEGILILIRMEALHYIREKNSLRCQLCPHYCLLSEGQSGLCHVRTNRSGKLVADNYGKLCSIHSDPIEKKPLYHFFPGRRILSLGSVGCNLHCRFCQNWEISQCGVEGFHRLKEYSPREIVAMALEEDDNIGLAFTYNEPTVWYEFMKDIAALAASTHLKSVMVTNGFINTAPLGELLPLIHAFSVDLKAFNDAFYRRLTLSRLEPVLGTLRAIRKAERHLEVTNLLIPGENDSESDFRSMLKWMRDELGPETVLHISRYFPTYKMNNPPTPENLLLEFYDIAKEYLSYVYLGNVQSEKGRDTYCRECGALLIRRSGYHTSLTGLTEDLKCKVCGATSTLNS